MSGEGLGRVLVVGRETHEVGFVEVGLWWWSSSEGL